MALQFNINRQPLGPTKEEALASTLGPALQGLPSLLFQYKAFKQQQELADKEHELKKRSYISQFGTGEPSPTQTEYKPSDLPGSTLAPSPKLDPMASSVTTPVPETAEEMMNRLGTQGVETLGKLEALRAKQAGKGPKDENTFTQENQMRTQYLGQVKEFKTIRDSYKRIRDSATDPSAAGDLALIFNYMKVLDPGSSVREGEFANAQNAAGIPDRIRAQWNKVLTGERLSEDQRNDFVTRADKLYKGQVDVYKNDVREFRRIAEKSGLDPDQVVIDLLADALETPADENAVGSPNSVVRLPQETQVAEESPDQMVPTIFDDKSYNALPSGAQYKAPDGSLRRKK